jgi:hypothetical protein
MFVKNVNMVNIHFSARTVRGLVYVFMENRKAPAKAVADQVYALINELNKIAPSVMEPRFASITNAGLAVKRAKVGASAIMEN